MSIGLKIRNIRLQKGYSQEYMADSLNISQKTYSHLENQKTRLHLSRLAKIAAVFDLSLAQMVNLESSDDVKTTENTQLNNALTHFNRQLEELREEIRLLRQEGRFR